MDPTAQGFLNQIIIAFVAGAVQSQGAQRDHHVGLLARQGDYAAQDNRLITAAVMNELFTGTDASKYASLQTASHVPANQQYPVPYGYAGGVMAPKTKE